MAICSYFRNSTNNLRKLQRSHHLHDGFIDVSFVPNDRSVQTAKYTCPDANYIHIPANKELGIEHFCVMATEAKGWQDINSNGTVEDSEIHSSGFLSGGFAPFTFVSKLFGRTAISDLRGGALRALTQVDALIHCNSLNTETNLLDNESDLHNNGTYSLLSNLEWIAIAKNIENVAVNWTGGVVGTGCLTKR